MKKDKKKSKAGKKASEAQRIHNLQSKKLTSEAISPTLPSIDADGMPLASSRLGSTGLNLKEFASGEPAEAAAPSDMLKAAFYVDGFNLYHGIDDANISCLKWLDLNALASRLIGPKERLVKVVWCTAIPQGDSGKSRRHMIYKNALKSVGVIPLEGHFSFEDIECKAACANRQKFRRSNEKEGDVNVAINAVADGITGVYDVCYIVTGDTDQAATLHYITQIIRKRVFIVFPPNRFHTQLLKNKFGHINLDLETLDSCRLADEIHVEGKKPITCPDEYRRPKGLKLPATNAPKGAADRQKTKKTFEKVTIKKRTFTKP